MSSTLEKAKQYIPAEFRMISGCRDDQTSADVQNVATFQLPDPAGSAGGACTSAMLKILYNEKHQSPENYSFQELLLQMRDVLSSSSYSQIPQLTSSRPLDVKSPFSIVPENFSGKRYAVMIGINYVGQQGQLSGCHNDVGNMVDYLKDVWGFTDSDMTILMDDGNHTEPTRDNILNAYKNVVSKAKSGDVVFCHYSGHGGKLQDDTGDEADGFDETLVPLDYNTNGQVRDDDLYKTLVGAMPEGVIVTVLMDCCHSGTVLDLPYIFVADGTQEEMTESPKFNFNTMVKLFNVYQDYRKKIKAGQSPMAAAFSSVTQVANVCGIKLPF